MGLATFGLDVQDYTGYFRLIFSIISDWSVVKNQYFGDISDYRKYDLLRALAVVGGLKIGVAWMLTPEDGRTDGGRIC
jgi:hypothetical protein